MHVKLRYVTHRVNRRSGKKRWYWQRPGKPLTRLPDNPIERMAMAERLNAATDGAATEPERASIGWVVEQYKGSDEYRDLSSGTVAYGPTLPLPRRVRAPARESRPKIKGLGRPTRSSAGRSSG
jgi:hypothetical protein